MKSRQGPMIRWSLSSVPSSLFLRATLSTRASHQWTDQPGTAWQDILSALRHPMHGLEQPQCLIHWLASQTTLLWSSVCCDAPGSGYTALNPFTPSTIFSHLLAYFTLMQFLKPQDLFRCCRDQWVSYSLSDQIYSHQEWQHIENSNVCHIKRW